MGLLVLKMSNTMIKTFYLLIYLNIFECQVKGQKISFTNELGSYRINKKLITLSGFSSGGTFAQQLYFSYSSLIQGIAVFSHTHYRCGPVTNSQEAYDNACTTLGGNVQPYDINLVFRDINDYHSQGLIENPSNMRNKPLYNYVGTANWLFTTEMSLRIGDVFRPYIQNEGAIRTVIQDANTTLPTNRLEFPPCSAPPNDLALSNCDFSGALDALHFLLGSEVVQQPSPNLILEPLLTFDQTEFFFGFDGVGGNANQLPRHDMDSVGYMYVPSICRGGSVKCYLHFYFHGCSVGREFVGAAHIQNSGFLEVAEMNSIIMVFPQVLASPENDIGCWDTYGFTGPLYATQRGAQVTVVRNMISRIVGGHDLQRQPERDLPFPNFNFGQPLNLQQHETGVEPVQKNFVSRFLEDNADIFRYLQDFRNF